MNPYAEAVGMLVVLVLVVFFGVLAGLNAIHPGLDFFFIVWVGLLLMGISTAFRFRERGPKNAALWCGIQLAAFSIPLTVVAYLIAGARGLSIVVVQIADMADYVLAVSIITFIVITRRRATDSST